MNQIAHSSTVGLASSGVVALLASTSWIQRGLWTAKMRIPDPRIVAIATSVILAADITVFADLGISFFSKMDDADVLLDLGGVAFSVAQAVLFGWCVCAVARAATRIPAMSGDRFKGLGGTKCRSVGYVVFLALMAIVAGGIGYFQEAVWILFAMPFNLFLWLGVDSLVLLRRDQGRVPDYSPETLAYVWLAGMATLHWGYWLFSYRLYSRYPSFLAAPADVASRALLWSFVLLGARNSERVRKIASFGATPAFRYLTKGLGKLTWMKPLLLGLAVLTSIIVAGYGTSANLAVIMRWVSSLWFVFALAFLLFLLSLQPVRHLIGGTLVHSHSLARRSVIGLGRLILIPPRTLPGLALIVTLWLACNGNSLPPENPGVHGGELSLFGDEAADSPNISFALLVPYPVIALIPLLVGLPVYGLYTISQRLREESRSRSVSTKLID